MNSDPRIRLAEPRDVSAIGQCAESAYDKYVVRIGKKPAPMVTDFGAAVSLGQVQVMETQEGLCGYVLFYPRGDHLHLENVAVDPRYQGRGYGRRLVSHVEKTAQVLGFRAVELYTNVKMTENLRMYPAMGYCETERRTEDGYERVYFRKAF